VELRQLEAFAAVAVPWAPSTRIFQYAGSWQAEKSLPGVRRWRLREWWMARSGRFIAFSLLTIGLAA
jgi:hypothetical protein